MKIAIDEERFAEAGLVYSRDGDVATFYTADKPDPVEVAIVDEQLVFCEGRSGGQRRVLSLISG